MFVFNKNTAGRAFPKPYPSLSLQILQQHQRAHVQAVCSTPSAMGHSVSLHKSLLNIEYLISPQGRVASHLLHALPNPPRSLMLKQQYHVGIAVNHASKGQLYAIQGANGRRSLAVNASNSPNEQAAEVEVQHSTSSSNNTAVDNKADASSQPDTQFDGIQEHATDSQHTASQHGQHHSPHGGTHGAAHQLQHRAAEKMTFQFLEKVSIMTRKHHYYLW
jgi:hypothetical protein